MTQIGFIGLGTMGNEMARRLLEANYNLSVFNRTQEKMEPFIKHGAKAASDVASLAKDVEIVLTCLSMPADVVEVYTKKDGILNNLRPGSICLDFTTVGMDTSLYLAKLAEEKKIIYLDSPISGGPEGAANGSLSIMVGGDKKAFETVLPVLEVLGKNIQHFGGSGLGSAAKLINQYLVAINSVAVSEAMVTGTALGLNPEQLYNLLKTSYGDSKILRRHMEEYVLDRNFKPGGQMQYILKDVRLASEIVRQAGIEPTAGQTAEKLFVTAIDEGLAELDMSAVIQVLEKKAGVIVKR